MVANKGVHERQVAAKENETQDKDDLCQEDLTEKGLQGKGK